MVGTGSLSLLGLAIILFVQISMDADGGSEKGGVISEKTILRGTSASSENALQANNQ
jgi:hypothetical protein